MASALTATTVKGVSLAHKVNRTASKSTVAPRVVCRASMKDNVQKVAAAVTAAPVLLASNPAYAAYVEQRMNGDGTGRILGINESALGFAILGVFTLVWALFAISSKELGGDDGDESGLTL